jgi:tRNA/rRNA methyltransferase
MQDGHLVPLVARLGIPVARLIDDVHEKGIATATAQWSAAGIDQAGLEPVLTYCAEQRCKSDGATCPGCRMRTAKLGLKTLDDFIAQYAEVEANDSGIRIPARGHGSFTTGSLEALAKSWAGEEYWFWARRVLRKLRHGIRRATRSGAP